MKLLLHVILFGHCECLLEKSCIADSRETLSKGKGFIMFGG